MWKKIYIPYVIFAIIVGITAFLLRNENYYLGILVQAAQFSLIVMGLSLLIGYAGQISLGHAAFFGIGAYSSAIFTGTYEWSPWFAMVGGMFIAAVLAWIIAKPSLKLKGHYLAMATLGFGVIIHIFFTAEVDITGGPSGYTKGIIPMMKFFSLTIDEYIEIFILNWIIVLIILLLNLHLIHSRIGRALRAIHSDEGAARAMGVKTSHYKVRIFVLSAIYASIAGSLYAHYIGFVGPSPFSLMESVRLVTMVIIGGMGSIWGAIFGAVFLSILPEFLSFVLGKMPDGLPEIFKRHHDYQILIYGVLLLVIMMFEPAGLIGVLRKLWMKIYSLLKKGENARA